MTQEEKANAYNEAIEKARKELQVCGSLDCDAARQIFRFFPELKESEDEKIRKELIEHVKDQQSSFISAPDCRDKYEEEENNKYNSWLVWLEKQGKQKPSIEMKTPEESLGINSATYNKIVDECIYGEQKSWNEENEHRIKLLEALCEDKLCESVPNSTMYEEMKITIDWLKSLRPQPKQEWSEEDQNALEDVREAVVHYWGGDTQDILLYWLKSLKQRIKKEAV